MRIGQPEGLRTRRLLRRVAASKGLIRTILRFFTFKAGRQIRGKSAGNPGGWGNFLRIEVERNTGPGKPTFNLLVSEVAISGKRTNVSRSETFRNLTMEPGTAKYAVDVVNL